MGVQELSRGKTAAAWLYGFRISSATLLPDHQHWLDEAIVGQLTAEHRASGARQTSDDHAWQIWVVGTTSRTGSGDFNLGLSQRRAEAVRTYLGSRLTSLMVVWAIAISSWGELKAILEGAADGTEDAHDRSAYVVMERVGKLQPKPPLPRPPVKPVQELVLKVPSEADIAGLISVAQTVLETKFFIEDIAGAVIGGAGGSLFGISAGAVVTAAGPFLGIGLPVLQAHQDMKNRGLREGYALGAAAALADYSWSQARNYFAYPSGAVSDDVFYHHDGVNRGLAAGYVTVRKWPKEARLATTVAVFKALDPATKTRVSNNQMSDTEYIRMIARVLSRRFIQ